MRKVVVSMNVTLNGYMAGPHGELDWHYNSWDDGMAHATAKHLAQADTIVLGRLTYQAMAGYWQAMANNHAFARDDIAFADMMNNYAKVVFSKTLTNQPAWNNTRLTKTSIAKEIKALKQQNGKDIIIYGSGKIVAALNRLNLVDEYRLWLHPIAIKKGRLLFKGLKKSLIFTGKQDFASGVVLMNYSAG